MGRFLLFLFLAIILISIDQYIKYIFVNGFRLESSCISLVLTFNKGVAFSMFSFLGGYLKYIQIGLFFVISLYLYKNRDIFYRFFIPFALLFGGGVSNVVDRFIYEGVVDYIYWHCWFDFAIFNFADILIDISIVLFLVIEYRFKKRLNTHVNS